MKYVSFLFLVASFGLLPAVADAAQIDKMYTSNGTPYIFINGEIVSGDAKRFHAALTEDMTGHSPKMVRLNSPGGEVYEGWELAQEMAKYHMSSIVTHDDFCVSSCFSSSLLMGWIIASSMCICVFYPRGGMVCHCSGGKEVVAVSEAVHDVLYVPCPLLRAPRLVECLPGYGLSECHSERLVHVLVHLVYKEQLCDVELYAQPLAPVCERVEERGVLSAEVYGHHVAVRLHAFGDERLCPWYVVYLAVYAARAQSCREHEHVVVAAESRLYHLRELAALLARLVDGNTYWCETRQVHQQVVDEVSEVPVVAAAYDGSERHAVGSAERVV